MSFEAILTKIMVPDQPISRTISVLGDSESGKENKFVKVLSPNMKNPILFQQSIHRNMRDFTNLYSSFVAVVKMTFELVSRANRTLIMPSEKNMYEDEVLVPGVFPRLFANAITKFNIGRGVYFERPMDVSIIKTDLNFLYCDTPKQGHANILDFSPLFLPFHTVVWLIVIAAIFLLTLVSFAKIIMEVYLSLGFGLEAAALSSAFNLHTFSSIVWSLFSVLISVPSYFGLQYHLKSSILFVIWIVGNLILSNFYTAILTSLLIQPIPEKTLQDLQDLVDHKYSLIFAESSPNVYETVVAAVKSNKESKIQSSNFSSLNDFDRLGILITDNPERQLFKDDEFLRRIALGTKSAAIGTWLYAWWMYQRSMGYIKSTFEKQPQQAPKVKCYMGKKMVAASALFWGYYPPNTEWLYETHLGFAANGVDGLWLKKFYGLNFAKRVQDRARAKSETEVAPDPESLAPTPIKLDDSHFITVIMLGVLCTGFSLFVFLIEFSWFYVFSKDNVRKIGNNVQNKNNLKSNFQNSDNFDDKFRFLR